MKTLVRNYTFDKVSKQVTFNGLEAVELEQILLITNVTNNQIIYNFADPTMGGTVNGNVLTLDYNTSAMSNDDDLQIFIDQPNYQDTEALANVMLDGLAAIVSQLQSMKKAQGIPDTAGRLRVMPEGGTITTVSTVSSVTNMAQMGGYYLQPFMFAQINQAWVGLRSKIAVY